MSRNRRFPKMPSRPHKSGQARISIGGKDFYLGKFGTPEAATEYARLANDYAAKRPLLPRDVIPTGQMTIANLIAAWLTFERDHGRGEKHPEVERIIRATVPLDRLFGATRADEFTAKRLEQVQLSMRDSTWMTADEKDTLKQWSRNYVNKQIDRIIRIFRWAEKEGMVGKGTLEHLRSLEPIKSNDKRAKHTKPVAACDWESQVKPCLPHLTPQVAALVELQWLAAMRPSEVVAITRGEIDRQSVPGVWLYRPSKHKTEHRGHELVKVLGPRSQTILAPWLLAAPDDKSPIFRGQRKRGRYTVDGYNRAITRACVAADVVRWTAYSLRHAAKLHVTQTHGLDAARAMLGHSSMTMTAKYSSAIDLKTAAEVARQIG